jgi:hypothetical protein
MAAHTTALGALAVVPAKAETGPTASPPLPEPDFSMGFGDI